MFLIKGQIQKGKMRVEVIYNLDAEGAAYVDRTGGIEVEVEPTYPDPKRGYYYVAWIDIATKEYSYEEIERPLTLEEEIEVLREENALLKEITDQLLLAQLEGGI